MYLVYIFCRSWFYISMRNLVSSSTLPMSAISYTLIFEFSVARIHSIDPILTWKHAVLRAYSLGKPLVLIEKTSKFFPKVCDTFKKTCIIVQVIYQVKRTHKSFHLYFNIVVHLDLVFKNQSLNCKPVLRIRDILAQIRIRTANPVWIIYSRKSFSIESIPICNHMYPKRIMNFWTELWISAAMASAGLDQITRRRNIYFRTEL
jgi:hypothetical protein